jgi:hypothetical protein
MRWTRDDAEARRVLVDNPMRLYGPWGGLKR